MSRPHRFICLLAVLALTAVAACDDGGGGTYTPPDADTGGGGDVTPDTGPTCENECEQAGGKQCNGNAVQTCSDFDGDGCLEWGGDQDCLSGLVCSNGFCSIGCEQACTVQGARKCAESGTGYQVCTDTNFDGCLEWAEPVACSDGKVCSNGNCSATCTDECTVSGARQCEGTTGWVVCGEHDGDGCLEWGGGSTCAGEEVCSGGFCTTNCQSQCTVIGANKCSGNGVQTCGDTNADGCLEWGTAVACDEGLSCSNGFCVQDCSNECTVKGASTCEGTGFKVCDDYDSNGCLEWGTVQSCEAGQSCSNGKCSATCTDECTVQAAKKCLGAAVQVCGDTDADACLEWGTATPCGEGETCSNGFCTASCSDECTVKGAKTCEGDGFKVCDDYNDDGCLEWGTVTSCAGDQTCSAGNCSSTCSDECTFTGAKQCQGDAVEACGDHDADPCLEWGTADPCDEGLVCAAGSCSLSCVDECTVKGARQCDGSTAFQVCDDYNTDGCLEWGTATQCNAGAVCSNGNCALDCSDECPSVGTKQCNIAGNAYQTCDDHDSDGCLEWSSDVACGDTQVCSGGNCASECTDECQATGLTQCNAAGTGVQTCGDYNQDGCLQWGTAEPCASTAVCEAGACEALAAPGTVVINEILYDDTGADASGFVELYGEPGLDLSGFTLRGINGANNQPYQEIALSGSLDSAGFFVVATPESTQALLDMADMTDSAADYQNSPDSVQLLWGEAVVDAVGYGTFGGTDSFAGEGSAAPDVSEGQTLGRDASGTDTDDNSADFKTYSTWTPAAVNGAGNASPTAVVACPDGGKAGESLTFDASGSSDSDGTITSYAFAFGDGATLSGPQTSVTHAYTTADTYTVTLTVTDDVGATATDTCSVTLADPNAPKVTWVKPVADMDVTQGDTIGITVDVTPGPGKTIDYVELLVDGVIAGPADDSVPFQFTYTVPSQAVTGSDVSLQVRALDGTGLAGASSVRTLHVRNDTPVASFAAVITGNLKVAVDATGSSDTETATDGLEVRWDWDNDGSWDTSWSTTKTATHTYGADGEHTIALQIRDAVGQLDAATRTINFQSVQDVSGTIESTTWYGTINVTGNTTVPPGATVTIAPGTTVILVEVDQDGGGVGDYSLDVQGSLVVEGTAVSPVIFTTLDTDGVSDSSAWNKVVLGSGGTHSIEHAIFEFAEVALQVWGDATISNTEFRNSVKGLTVHGGTVTLTDVNAHDNDEDGVGFHGGTVTATNLTSTKNGARGVYMTGGTGHTVDTCSVTANGTEGIEIVDTSANITLCTIKSNGGTGAFYRGGAGGTLTRSQIQDNGEEGVRAITRGGHPSPIIQLNNIYGNATTGNLHIEEVNVKAQSNYGYGDATSSTWSTPNGNPVLMFEAGYTDTGSSTVTGHVQTGGGTAIRSFSGSNNPRTWYGLTQTTTSLRAFVDDNDSNDSGTMTIYSVAYVGASTGKQVVSLVSGGTTTARYNYLGTWPDVLAVVDYRATSHLDLQGFVGVPFDETFDTGPYWGGTTIDADTIWSSDVFVTGNLDVASGVTLAVDAGVTVTFVPTDQDGDTTGDWAIDRGAGTLNLAGTAGSPVTVDVLGDVPAKGGFRWLHGTGAGTTLIDHATVDAGFHAVRASGGTVAIADSTLSNTSSAALYVHGSADATVTDSSLVLAGGDGGYVTTSGPVTMNRVVVEDNAHWGLHFDSAAHSDNVVQNSEINGNAEGGVFFDSARVAVDHNNIKFNGFGVWLHDDARGAVTANNILFNTREGVFASVGVNLPTAPVNGNNIFGNSSAEAVWEETISLTAKSNYGYGDATSSTWSTPSGQPILTFEASYTDTGSSTVTGYVQTGGGTNAQTFYGSNNPAAWFDFVARNSSSIRAFVDDNDSNDSGTMTVHSVLYLASTADPERIVEMTVVGNHLTFDATGNYWGVFPSVADVIQEIVSGTSDFTGFKSTEITTAGPQ